MELEGLVDAKTLRKLSWDDFNIKRRYIIDAAKLDVNTFYPVVFEPSNLELDCEIHSPELPHDAAYNQNHIHFLLTKKGWNDTPQSFMILSQGVHQETEITIGSIGVGLEAGRLAVWIRGGMNYVFLCNRTPYLKDTNFTSGGETYTIGNNLTGGTNQKVLSLWRNDSTRNHGTFASYMDIKGANEKIVALEQRIAKLEGK